MEKSANVYTFKHVELKELSVPKVSYKEVFGVPPKDENNLLNKVGDFMRKAVDTGLEYAGKGANFAGDILVATGDNVSFGATKWIRNHTYDKENLSVNYESMAYKIGDYGATAVQVATGVGALKIGGAKLTATAAEKTAAKMAREAEKREQQIALNYYRDSDTYTAIGRDTFGDGKAIWAVKQEKLGIKPAETFNPNYQTFKTIDNTNYYRMFGNDAKSQGSYLTTKSNATREELAILDEWNNSMRFQGEGFIPANETFHFGTAAPQKGKEILQYLQGGGPQILVRDRAPVHQWTKNIVDRKTEKTYTAEEFKKHFPDQVTKDKK
ncbi:MAG: hypothetical protein IJ566_02275 [Cardiobacteriaceae bacterium]|nr:hypothetical protein [Cardiobacteriaceae bacterium]